MGQSLIDAAHSLFQQRIGKAREQGGGETTFGALHLAEEAETDVRHAVAIGTSTHQWAVIHKAQDGLVGGANVLIVAVRFVLEAHAHVSPFIAPFLRSGGTRVAESALFFGRDAVIIGTSERERAGTGSQQAALLQRASALPVGALHGLIRGTLPVRARQRHHAVAVAGRAAAAGAANPPVLAGRTVLALQRIAHARVARAAIGVLRGTAHAVHAGLRFATHAIAAANLSLETVLLELGIAAAHVVVARVAAARFVLDRGRSQLRRQLAEHHRLASLRADRRVGDALAVIAHVRHVQRTAVRGTQVLADAARVVPAAHATHRTLVRVHFLARIRRFIATEVVAENWSRLVAVDAQRAIRTRRRAARIRTAEGRFTGTALEGHAVGFVRMAGGVGTQERSGFGARDARRAVLHGVGARAIRTLHLVVEAALHVSAVARGTHAGSVGAENRAVGGTHAVGRSQTAGFDQLRRTGVEVRFLGAVAAKHVVVLLGALLIERQPERAVQRAAISAVQIALLCAQTRVCVLQLALLSTSTLLSSSLRFTHVS